MNKRWQPIVQILIAVAAVALIVFIQIRNRPVPVPLDFKAVAIDTGQEVSLSTYRGSPILLTAWTLDCTECKENLSNLQQIWQARGSRGLVTIAVNVSPTDSDDKIKALAAELGINIPIWHDRSNRYASLFQANKVPHSLIIDRKGTVNTKWDGVTYFQNEMIMLVVDFVINSSP